MTTPDNFLGNGWRFPIKPDATGRLGYVAGAENIEQSLKILLLTGVRERVMRRDFGSKARDLVFAPSSDQNLRLLESSLRDAIVIEEPRIDVIDLTTESDPADPTRFTVQIEYEIRAANTRGNLVFPFYLDTLTGET